MPDLTPEQQLMKALDEFVDEDAPAPNGSECTCQYCVTWRAQGRRPPQYVTYGPREWEGPVVTAKRRIADEDIERIAKRVVELLRGQ